MQLRMLVDILFVQLETLGVILDTKSDHENCSDEDSAPYMSWPASI